MTQPTYCKPTQVLLKSHPTLNEKWVQDRIAEDPAILGLGDLILKDKERLQPSAGRLDLLLQDSELPSRYEVEIQLGKTDESHIIRTLEYWDIERRRYPAYDHTAVLIAEDITSRFLNVISLFNGSIPLVAIKMQALQIKESVSLVFTTVLNQVTPGLEDEDDERVAPADKAYWEQRGSKATVQLADEVLKMVRELEPNLSLKYNKFYIGLSRDGQPNNFVIMRPKKEWIRVEIRLERSDEAQKALDDAGIDLMDYDAKSGRYKIRLTADELKRHHDVLAGLLKSSYDKSR